MSDITDSASAAREGARHNDTGKFGIQDHQDPGVVAMAPRFPNELFPTGGDPADADLFYQWQKDVLASISPFLETNMEPVSWRQHATAGQAGWEPHPALNHPFETLTTTLRLRDGDNVEYEVIAASRIVPYRAGPDFDLTELTFDQVRAATPAHVGEGVFFNSGYFDPAGDVNTDAVAVCRRAQESGAYGDEEADVMRRRWAKIATADPASGEAARYRAFLAAREQFPEFVKVCDAYPEFEKRLGHKVETVTTVNRAPGFMPEPMGRLARETTTFVTTAHEARVAAIPRNQAMVSINRPEDYFGDDGS